MDILPNNYKIMDDKDKRIKELEEVAMELYNLVHESDLIENKIKANNLYYIIKPEDISIYFYSSIIIDYSGVKYKPEHGSMNIILKFDKFFNIDVALNNLK